MRIGIIISLLLFIMLQSFGIFNDAESLNDSFGNEGGVICVVDMDEDEHIVFPDLNELAISNYLLFQIILKQSFSNFNTRWIDLRCLNQLPAFVSSDTSPPFFRFYNITDF